MEVEVIKELKEKYQDQRLAGFYSFVSQYSQYSDPNYINKNLVEDPLNTFIMPMFLKPGRQNVIVLTEGN
jgi:hypothetical protein